MSSSSIAAIIAPLPLMFACPLLTRMTNFNPFENNLFELAKSLICSLTTSIPLSSDALSSSTMEAYLGPLILRATARMVEVLPTEKGREGRRVRWEARGTQAQQPTACLLATYQFRAAKGSERSRQTTVHQQRVTTCRGLWLTRSACPLHSPVHKTADAAIDLSR
jgi:hypothetical protein